MGIYLLPSASIWIEIFSTSLCSCYKSVAESCSFQAFSYKLSNSLIVKPPDDTVKHGGTVNFTCTDSSKFFVTDSRSTCNDGLWTGNGKLFACNSECSLILYRCNHVEFTYQHNLSNCHVLLDVSQLNSLLTALQPLREKPAECLPVIILRALWSL